QAIQLVRVGANCEHSACVRDFVGASKELGDCAFHLHTLLVDGAVARILGISAFYHDSAACLVVDGEIIAAAQEERFTRIKHDHNFPVYAARYCLNEGGLTAGQLDYVAFYDKPLLKFDRLLETYLDYAPAGFGSFLKAMPLWMQEKLWMPDLIRTELARASGIKDDRKAKKAGKKFAWKLLFGDHHESHAASAFYPSPFE